MDLVADSVELELSERINDKVFYLHNLAAHWHKHHEVEQKIWQMEADFAVNQLNIYQKIGLISKKGQILWETSVKNSTNQPNFTSLLEKWSPQVTDFQSHQPIVRVIFKSDGLAKENLVLIYIPLIIPDNFEGFLIAVLEFQPIFDTLSDISNVYQFNLIYNKQILLSSQNNYKNYCSLSQPKKQIILPFLDNLQLEICPKNQTITQNKLDLSIIILIGGLSLAIGLPSFIKAWQTTRNNNEQMKKLNQELALEIKQRQQVQFELSQLNTELEKRVEQRTNEFQAINQQLRDEILNRERMELALAESEALYRQMIETAEEGIWIIDTENRTYFVNQKMALMLGYTVEEMIDRNILEFIEPSWQQQYLDNLQYHLQGINEQQDFKFKCKDNSSLWVIISTSAIFDNFGNYSGTLRMITDISDRKRVEDERTKTEEQLKTSLREKELLLKEINHRLKNNLLLISTLIDLQIERLKEPSTIQLFEDTQQRIHSMALIHEKLFQSPDLAKVNFGNYLSNLAEEIAYSYNFIQRNIQLELALESIELNLETANPCGLIVNELLVNAVKHAFPGGRSGTIWLKLKKNHENLIALIIEDNGVGFPENLNFYNYESLGLHLVHTLTKQIEGKLQLDRVNKTSFQLIFSELNYSKRI